MSRKKKKKGSVRYQVISGMMDVIGTALAALAIIVLMLMLSSLFSWLRKDIKVTFSDLGSNIGGAFFVTE